MKGKTIIAPLLGLMAAVAAVLIISFRCYAYPDVADRPTAELRREVIQLWMSHSDSSMPVKLLVAWRLGHMSDELVRRSPGELAEQFAAEQKESMASNSDSVNTAFGGH